MSGKGKIILIVFCLFSILLISVVILNLPEKYELQSGDQFSWSSRPFAWVAIIPDVETNVTIISETSTNRSVHIRCDTIVFSTFDLNMTVSKNGSVGGFSECYVSGNPVGYWILWIDLKHVSEIPTLLLDGNLTFIPVSVLHDDYVIKGPFNFYIERGKYLLDANKTRDVWVFYDIYNGLSLFYDAATGLMLNVNYDANNGTYTWVIRMNLEESTVGSIFTPKYTPLMICIDSKKLPMQMKGGYKGL